jgi:hypothetical protein
VRLTRRRHYHRRPRKPLADGFAFDVSLRVHDGGVTVVTDLATDERITFANPALAARFLAREALDGLGAISAENRGHQLSPESTGAGQ